MFSVLVSLKTWCFVIHAILFLLMFNMKKVTQCVARVVILKCMSEKKIVFLELGLWLHLDLLPLSLRIFFPVMVITQLGSGTFEKTILGGVKNMAEEQLYGLAAIVFVASVVVPLFKLLGLSYLLWCIQKRKLNKRFQLTRMYRFIVFIGRWSMVDIFFAALFISLLQLGNFVNIHVGLGAPAFAMMCVITMVAGELFDPRLLWDHEEKTLNV